jgi:N-acetylmuramoyl-L-alanine amidase
VPIRLSLVCLVLAGVILSPPFIDNQGEAAARSHASDTSTTRSHQHRLPTVKYTPKAQRANHALVRNVRALVSADHTRLVLDLDRKVPITQRRESHPARVVIQLKQARLSKDAQAQLAKHIIPPPFAVTQSHHRGVTVAFLPSQARTYRVMPLSNPDRVVVDLYPQPQNPSPRAVELPTPEGPAAVESPSRSGVRSSATTVKTIVIDAGHGGRDSGTIGHGGTHEKDVTLKVSLLLRSMLSRWPNTRVLMTRERDVFVELEDRAKFANSSAADLFVSIHVNSHPQRSIKGLEVYHFGEAQDQRALEVAARENGTPLNSTGVGWEYLVADLLTTKKIEESLELAWSTKEALVFHVHSKYQTVDHGVKTAPFYVLRFTSMPSVLAEIAFMSNPAEEKLMRTEPFLTKMAEGIAEGIRAFLSQNRTASK